MKIIYKSKLVPKGFSGITLYPFVFLRDSKEEIANKRGLSGLNRLINHERIHLKQQIELLVIPFYLIYFFNWIVNLFKNSENAYRNICFEKEAYNNESNLKYLKTRKFWSWLKYF